jgi:hypothetical protein
MPFCSLFPVATIILSKKGLLILILVGAGGAGALPFPHHGGFMGMAFLHFLYWYFQGLLGISR